MQNIPRPKRKTWRRGRASGWAIVSVRGMNIECYSGRGRRLLVPISGESLDQIIQHLSLRAGEALHHPRVEDETTIGDLLAESDAGKIAWRSSKQASGQCVGFWQIVYKNHLGVVVRGRAGLSVPRANLAGTPWSKTEQMNAAAMVLNKARVEWNRLDCSDAARLPVETCETT